jgi:1-acyl-sn-glycerol-3-phosphate acyltransferase
MGDSVVVPFPRDDASPGNSAEWSGDAEPGAKSDGPLTQALSTAVDVVGARLRGDFEVDEFGLDPQLADHALLPPFRVLYRHWFRVQTQGLDHVPDEGGVLLVANHGGTIGLDSIMTSLALLDDHPAHRRLRVLGGDFVFRTPFLGRYARAIGSTLACRSDVDRLLAAGEAVGVWPEGYKGVGKRYGERYRLQRFGRGGFVAAALRAQVPIVPVSIVGAEETYPMLGDIAPLARLLGLPYFPVTPTFPWLGPAGAVPLPSRWIIDFGEPFATDEFGPEAADDPGLVLDLTDRVRESIQATLPTLLDQRGPVFSSPSDR